MRYGANAIELSVNGLLSIGAKRKRLEAKLFDGGEGIQLLGGSTRGRDARRIQCWPVSGRVRQLVLNIKLDAIPKSQPPSADALANVQGSVEMF